MAGCDPALAQQPPFRDGGLREAAAASITDAGDGAIPTRLGEPALRDFLRRFCADEDYAWRHVRWPLPVLDFDPEGPRPAYHRRLLRRRVPGMGFCQLDCSRPSDSCGIVRSGTGWRVEFPAVGGRAWQVFESHGRTWRLIACHLCGSHPDY